MTNGQPTDRLRNKLNKNIVKIFRRMNLLNVTAQNKNGVYTYNNISIRLIFCFNSKFDPPFSNRRQSTKNVQRKRILQYLQNEDPKRFQSKYSGPATPSTINM